MKPALTIPLAALLIAFCGCTSGGADSDDPTVDAGCSEETPRYAQPFDPAQGEEQYLDDIVPCYSETSDLLHLTNNSDAVWFFDVASPVTYTVITETSTSRVFRDWAETGVAERPFMVPGETVEIENPPEPFHYYLYPELSISWAGASVISDRVIDAGTDAVAQLATEGSPSRTAVWQCASAVDSLFDFAWSEGSDSFELVSDGIGVAADGGRCATAWENARRADSKLPVALIDEADNSLFRLTGSIDDILKVAKFRIPL
jgi:hypothetical protein